MSIWGLEGDTTIDLVLTESISEIAFSDWLGADAESNRDVRFLGVKLT